MHIHNQPVNLYATDIHSPAKVAAQQAVEIRRRLARAASSLGEESDPFESFMPEPQEQASTPASSLDDLPLRVRGYAAQGVSL
jgi:hypothetical protein